MVECFLAKEDVAGSTPVSRSNQPLHLRYTPDKSFFVPAPGCCGVGNEARYPSGKGEVCKTFMRRFDPDPRLQSLQGDSPRKGASLFAPAAQKM